MHTDKLLLANTRCIGNQQGAATLVIAVVLLVIVLGISFFTAEIVISEKKVTANVYRAKQAFHAAQAGIDFGISYSRKGLDQNDDSILDLTVASAAVGTVGSASYQVSFADVSAASDMSLIQVSSIGTSDDGLINREIEVLIGKVPLVPNPPDLPIVARGNVAVSGNLNVYNVFTNLNIWSGDSLDSWGSADTYIRDPDWTDGGSWDGVSDLHTYLSANNMDASDVAAIQSTTKNTRGPDIIEGDTNLATITPDQFTENFFGKTLDELVSSANLSMTGNELSSAAAADVSGKLIYLSDAKLTGGTIGSPSKPVVIVVDSPLDLSGSPVIYGIIIASSINKVAGTVDIFGGLVSEGNIDTGVGSANIYYDESVILGVQDLYTMEVIRGSWQDWTY